jgi:hypothetical protein
VLLWREEMEQGTVTHACNPSYSGGRDQEDCGLKPAQANRSWDPAQKYPSLKGTCGVAQGKGSEFKPQYCKKNLKKEMDTVQQSITVFWGCHICFYSVDQESKKYNPLSTCNYRAVF